MKQHLKRIYKSEGVHKFLAWVGSVYIRFVLRTSRVTFHHHPSAQTYYDNNEQAIFAFWHSRIMLMYKCAPTGRRMSALVSGHSDGRMIGRILLHLGLDIVHGSTSKGGAKALKQLVKAYHAGSNLTITPDGPRGPAQKASEGVAQLAILTKAPIICLAYTIKRYKVLKSWDKFVIALPFSEVHFVSSEPIQYKPDSGCSKQENRERFRQQVECKINEVTEQADAFL